MAPDPSQPQLTIMPLVLSRSRFPLAPMEAQALLESQESRLKVALMESAESQPQSLLTGIPLPLTMCLMLTGELLSQASAFDGSQR
jgi:hypothetical protein